MMSAGSAVFGTDPCLAIRRLVRQDLPAVREILEEGPGAAPWSAQTLQGFTAADSAAWVAERAGCVAGFLIGRLVSGEFEILNMAVSRAYRANGIGSKLLEFALAFSEAAGSSAAYLEVRASNLAAIALYARHGFTECGRRFGYYRGPDEDALIFSRRKGAPL